MISALTIRRPWGQWLTFAAMTIYVVLCVIVFVRWMGPTLEGRAGMKIAADSDTYMYMADVVRGDRSDPRVFIALASFPNTLWVPVFIAFVLKRAVWMAIANAIAFTIAIRLFRRSAALNMGLFLSLLLLNPTTTVSLLSVNKEMVDFLVVALFCYSRVSHKKWALASALFISFFNRYEVCLALLCYMWAQSRLNPARQRRALTLAGVVLMLNFAIPLASSHLGERFDEAEGGGVVVLLNSLETHYLYFVAVVPKILQNLFGELLNTSHWGQYDSYDIANTYILLFNNLASGILLLLLMIRKSLSLQNNWVYLAAIGAILMALSPVIQPRYFYFCYVILCFHAAQYQRAAHLQPGRTEPIGAIVAT